MSGVYHVARAKRRSVVFAIVASLALAGLQARASSVVPMNLAALSDHAGQVIVGTVAAVRCYWEQNPPQILSEVTFEGVEYLKGGRPDIDPTFTLVVPGGTVGTMEIRVCGAPNFAVGERWLLCLLPSYKTFPVVGISQGAFRLVPDAEGVARVYRQVNETLLPITGIDAKGLVQVNGTCQSAPRARVVGGENTRVRIRSAPANPARAMSYGQFLARLGPILQRSKDHHLTGPAGQRIPVRYVPVPLQASPSQRVGEQAPTKRTSELRGLGSATESKQAATHRSRSSQEVEP